MAVKVKGRKSGPRTQKVNNKITAHGPARAGTGGPKRGGGRSGGGGGG